VDTAELRLAEPDTRPCDRQRTEPALQIVYRICAAENAKPRPAFYDKTLALVSLLRAAEKVVPSPAFTFLVDGSLPESLIQLMARHGRVVPISAGSTRRSFRQAVALAAVLDGGPDDLVWFAEDDYLYQPRALAVLLSAATEMPDAQYFMMTGSNALDLTVPGRSADRLHLLPGAEGDPPSRVVAGVRWFRGESTTSTFAVRRKALLEDARLLRFVPYTGGSWDRTTCLAYQGFRPFRARDIFPVADEPVHRWPRIAVRGLFRAAAVARSLRRSSRRRVLVGADPELVLHMETFTEDARGPLSAASAGTDWAGIAADTRRWAAERGLTRRSADPRSSSGLDGTSPAPSRPRSS
jgi:hypothetical protein